MPGQASFQAGMKWPYWMHSSLQLFVLSFNLYHVGPPYITHSFSIAIIVIQKGNIGKIPSYIFQDNVITSDLRC